MNTALKLLLVGVGSVSLFTVSFVGAALLQGAGLHELPMVGSLFHPPPVEPDEDAPADPAPPAPPLDAVPARAGIGLLDVFRIDGPLDPKELRALADDLKRKRALAEQRLAELDEREQRLGERVEFLDEQFQSLQSLRSSLESWELELEARQEEVDRDETAQSEREAVSWQRMAKLFEKGEAETLAFKLQAYTPAEAARILSRLKPDRARALLEALTTDGWKDYWDAYGEAQTAPSE